MACCGQVEADVDEINGQCPDCGEPTIDGEAVEQCRYSPLVCVTCGHRPCDGSC